MGHTMVCTAYVPWMHRMLTFNAEHFTRHFIARAIGLIIIPAFVYI